MAKKKKDTKPGTRSEARKVSDADNSTEALAGTYADLPDADKPDPSSILQTQDVGD
jgi:hypothetical protein